MIELKHINKVFHTQKGDIEACRDVNLTIQDGEIFGSYGIFRSAHRFMRSGIDQTCLSFT